MKNLFNIMLTELLKELKIRPIDIEEVSANEEDYITSSTVRSWKTRGLPKINSYISLCKYMCFASINTDGSINNRLCENLEFFNKRLAEKAKKECPTVEIDFEDIGVKEGDLYNRVIEKYLDYAFKKS